MEEVPISENNGHVRMFKPPWKRFKALKTAAVYSSFLVAGLSYAILGPSIPSLEILLNTSTKHISAGFTANSIGYMCGSVLCGFVYTKLNKEMMFMVCLAVALVTTALVPNAWHLFVFIAILAVQGLFMAFVDTGAQPYILKLWEEDKYKNAMMQALHSFWSIGATVGPFILHPFLADLHVQPFPVNQSFPEVNVTTESSTLAALSSLPDLDPVPTVNAQLVSEVSTVRKGYYVIAGIISIAVVIFCAAFILSGPSFLDKQRKRSSAKTSNKTESTSVPQSVVSKRFKIRLLCIVAVSFFFFTWVESLPGNFLATYVVKGIKWKNDHGALITSTYWGSHGLGRILGIALAMCFKPKQMVIADLSIAALGFSLLFAAPYHFSIPWIATSVSGIGIGTLFSSQLLFIDEYVEVTGAVASVIVTSTSFGGIICPLPTGYLMEHFSYKALPYVCMFSIIAETLLFIGIVIFVQRFGVRRHKHRTPQHRNKPQEDSASDPVEMKPLR